MRIRAFHLILLLAGVLATACAPLERGRTVKVGEIHNRARAKTRLVLGTARFETPWQPATADVVLGVPLTLAAGVKGDVVPSEEKGSISGRPAKGQVLAGLTKGEVEQLPVKGRTAAAGAKGRAIAASHIPVTELKAVKGRYVLEILQPRLSITKVPAKEGILPDEAVCFTITVTNLSLLPVRDLVVVDSYDEDLEFVGCDDPDAEVQPSPDGGGTVEFRSHQILNVGERVSYRVRVKLTKTAQEAISAENGLSSPSDGRASEGRAGPSDRSDASAGES